MVFSSMQRMMDNVSVVLLNFAGSLALENALWQNHCLFLSAKSVLIHLHPPNGILPPIDCPTEGNKRQYGGVALTRDHPFSPSPTLLSTNTRAPASLLITAWVLVSGLAVFILTPLLSPVLY